MHALYKSTGPETPETVPEAAATLQTVENEESLNRSKAFHEIGLHKPDFDETWYDHNYVTRRITARDS